MSSSTSRGSRSSSGRSSQAPKKKKAEKTPHPQFSEYRLEHHYTFVLAPAQYTDQVPNAIEAVENLIRLFTWQYEFHKHYADPLLAKEWDIWTTTEMPKELLRQIRRVEGVLHCFKSHPVTRMEPLSASFTEDELDSDEPETIGQ